MSMKESLLRWRNSFDRAIKEGDIDAIKRGFEYASQVAIMLCGDPRDREGYCVKYSHNTDWHPFSGTRDECIAFVRGYERADRSMNDDGGWFAVCVDVPSLPVVWPDDKIGQMLGDGWKEGGAE